MCTTEARKVTPLDNYKLLVEYVTGEKRLYDCSPQLQYEAFEPLKDVTLFNKVHVEFGAIVWNDDIDMSPDEPYINGRVIES